jgi:hypothetical protein
MTYAWTFGDGSKGKGKVVEHKYAKPGRFRATLTVTDKKSRKRSTMVLPVTVVGGTATSSSTSMLAPRAAQGGEVPLSWNYSGPKADLKGFAIERAAGVRTLLDGLAGDVLAKSPLQLGSLIPMPVTGTTQVSYTSRYTGARDDEGRLEIALWDGKTATKIRWQAIDGIGGLWTAGRDGYRGRAAAGAERRVVDLSPFYGKRILMRFRFLPGKLGNLKARWNVSDVRVTNGRWEQIATTSANAITLKGQRGLTAYRVRPLMGSGFQMPASDASLVSVRR